VLKHAYELGVQLALEEAGLEKNAFLGALGSAATKGISSLGKIPGGGKMIGWGIKHPLAARMGGGSAVGGVGGGLFGEEGGFARGALMGAGVGAGAYGGRLAALGKGGRASQTLLRRTATGQPTKFFQKLRPQMQANVVGAAQKNVQALAPKALGYGLGAGAGAGALGYGLSGSMLPGRNR